MTDQADRYERILQAHLEVNPKSWAALQARGVDEQTPLELDFEYTAPSEAEVRSLLRHLRATTDYEFQGGARDEDDGSRRWMVMGTTKPMTLTPQRLDAWVTEMTARGRDGGPADFDGWGARTPKSAPPPPPKGLRQRLVRGRVKR